jgi:hypothetical protein
LSATKVIYLHRLDTVDSLRVILANCAPQSQVWLVAPLDMTAFASLVNLKLLQRAAKAAAVDLRLVCLHSQIRTLAREAGIPAYWSLPFGLSSAGRSSSSTPLSARTIPVSARITRRFKRRPRVQGASAALLTLIVVVLILGMLVVSAVFIVPGATITLRPVTTQAQARFEVTADVRYHSADFERMSIPARSVEVVIDGRGDTPATGRLDVMEGHAEGEVVFTNKTSDAVKVPKGTIVRSGVGTPVRFYTKDEIELPAQQSGIARVGVTAIDAGPVGNVGALTINVIEGSLATQCDVLNDQPTEGGNVKRIATVAYGDFDRLRSDLISKLQQQAYDLILAGLSEGEFIPPSTVEVEVMAQTTDQVVDQQADKLAMTMKLMVRGLAVDGDALKQIATRYLETQATEDSAIIASTLKAEPSGEMRLENQTLKFGVLATGQLGQSIDIERVKLLVRGTSVEEADGLLGERLRLLSPAEIVLRPDWWPYLPWMIQQIRVQVVAEAR